jgi:parallel beta-helix repeat protein
MNSISIWNGRSSFFGRGIHLGASYNSIISNCTCNYNNFTGIAVYGGKSIIENSNCSSNNYNGISFYYSDDNVITGNNISSNDNYGVYFYNSSNYIIMNNNFSNNGVVIWGDQLSYFNTHRIPTNNIVNGDPLYYYKNCSGINISGIPIGQLILANCTDFDIRNLEINKTDVGVEIAYSTNIRVKNNEISSNNHYGIILYSSSNNTIKNNNISDNLQGIHLYSSSSNLIYHNNISNNMYQAFDDTNNTNDWDNGYPSGGNYWSDYGGVDNFKGPNQNIPGKDGIGDTPYDIDSDSRDNYPLLEPWKYYMILKQGWNLISLPLIQEERNLTRVLGSIDGWYDAVQWYNLRDTDDPWKHHKINKPYGNDLFEITEKMGFWIHITRPGDTIFIYNGTFPIQNLSISLTQGWNLVGYPSFTRHNRTEGLNNLSFYNEVDSILTYNAATRKWKKLGLLDYFEPCRGYWVHAKTKCEWEVPL